MKYNSLINTYYHGSGKLFDMFDYQYIQKFDDGKGNLKYGPGFYLAKSINDAEHYAKLNKDVGYIYEIEISPKKTITTKKLTNKEINFLIDNSPDKDNLYNYDENLIQARKIFLQHLKNQQSIEQLQSIWYDFYFMSSRNTIDYIKNCIKLGISGIYIKEHDFYILYDINCITNFKLLKTINIKK